MAVKQSISHKQSKMNTNIHFFHSKKLTKKRDPMYPNKSVELVTKMDKYRTIICPVNTEPAMKKIEEFNTLVFLVDIQAIKLKIKEAMKAMYDEQCAKINTRIRPDGRKKAYVSLMQNFDAT